MTRKAVFFVLFGVWLLLFAGSFVSYIVTAPDDMGFTRGLNRITAFLGWQLAAGFAGLVAWSQAGVFDRGSFGRWLGRAPAIVAGLLLLGIVCLIAWARLAPRPAPSPPIDREVTAPNVDVKPATEAVE